MVASMTEITAQTALHLRRVIARKQVEHRIPGIVAGVGRDGRLMWCEGVGAADLARPDDAPTADTQFLIASNTKTFTAVLVMALRDEGKVDLDDTVDVHIPESKHGGITIRQLLAHVTGMQREPIGDIWDTLEYPDREQLVEGWNRAERILRPHHKWHYSNLGFAMLGEIVARLDRGEWAESLQARILDPLEMRRTTVGLAGNAAVGYYVPPFTDVPAVEPLLAIKATAPAGALASTVADLMKWGAFLADPVTEVLAPDTVEEMCQPQIVADLTSWRMAWGLGLMLLRDDDRVWVGHDGGMPGHITSLLVDRPSKTVATVLTNSTTSPDPSGTAMELGGYVVEHEPPTPDAWRPGTLVPDELMPLLGTWYSEGRPFTFRIRQGRLEARLDAMPATMPPSTFARIAEDLYRTESGRETGELLRVNRGPAGVVTHLNWATYRFTREPYAFGGWL